MLHRSVYTCLGLQLDSRKKYGLILCDSYHWNWISPKSSTQKSTSAAVSRGRAQFVLKYKNRSCLKKVLTSADQQFLSLYCLISLLIALSRTQCWEKTFKKKQFRDKVYSVEGNWYSWVPLCRSCNVKRIATNLNQLETNKQNTPQFKKIIP